VSAAGKAADTISEVAANAPESSDIMNPVSTGVTGIVGSIMDGFNTLNEQTQITKKLSDTSEQLRGGVSQTAEALLDKTTDVRGGVSETAQALASKSESVMSTASEVGEEFLSTAVGAINSAMALSTSNWTLSSLTGMEMFNPIWSEYELVETLETLQCLVTMTIRSKKDSNNMKILRRMPKTVFPPEEIDRIRLDAERFRQEVHKSICSIYHIHETPSDIWVVMEYCDGGSLFFRQQKLKTLQEKEAALYVNQLAKVLTHLHERQFIYRDLKPQNIFLTSNAEGEYDVKLLWSPFIVYSSMPQKLLAGTLTFISPEMSLRKPYGCEIDIWALGVTLYILLAGKPPFVHREREALYYIIQSIAPDFGSKEWQNISTDAQELVQLLLKKDPNARLKGSDVPFSSFVLVHDPPLAG